MITNLLAVEGFDVPEELSKSSQTSPLSLDDIVGQLQKLGAEAELCRPGLCKVNVERNPVIDRYQ